jgi:hypothetical protein
MANIKVAVINASSVLTDDQVSAVVPDLQTQVHNDFAPAWGIDADLNFLPTGSNPALGSWWLVILDNSDQAGALGYHDYTPDGLPIGKVFAGTDMQYGTQWTVTASHELLEMLADPDVNLSAAAPDLNQPSPAQFYAYEVADACEADQFAYKINNTLVSDFVLPAWFESFRQPGSTQFDKQNQIKQPFQLLAGGYIGVLNLTDGEGWTQITDQKTPQTHAMRPHVGSRRERRRTPRRLWLKSLPLKRSRSGVASTRRTPSLPGGNKTHASVIPHLLNGFPLPVESRGGGAASQHY